MSAWRRRSGCRKSFKKSEISRPTQFEHRIHADFDPQTGGIRGLPVQWQSLLGPDIVQNGRPPPHTNSSATCCTVNNANDNRLAGAVFAKSTAHCSTNATSLASSSSVDKNHNFNADLYAERLPNRSTDANCNAQRQMSLKYVGSSSSDHPTTSSGVSSLGVNVRNNTTTAIASDEQFYLTLRSMVSVGDPRSDLSTLTKFECGSTSVVYASYLISRRRKVAIKRMNIWRQQRRELLFNEALVMRQLRHPNLVEMLDVYLVDDELWVIMEFMGGGSLTNLITYKRMEEPLIATVSRQCLDALAYLHAGDIIHRDIKSDSILLTENGVVKLSDFGFCGRLTPECRSRRSLLGTPYWFSAQVAAQQPYGCDADIWSFGVTVIEMIFGEPPYFNDPPATAMQKIIQLPPARIPAFAQVSPELDAFVNGMLVKEVDARASASQLLRHPFLLKADPHPNALVLLMRDVQMKKMESENL